jgi:hypothetical protein
MDKKYYAYSLDGKSPSEWQPFECKAVQSSDGGRRSAIAFYKAGFIHAIDEKNKIGAQLNGVKQFHCPS